MRLNGSFLPRWGEVVGWVSKIRRVMRSDCSGHVQGTARRLEPRTVRHRKQRALVAQHGRRVRVVPSTPAGPRVHTRTSASPFSRRPIDAALVWCGAVSRIQTRRWDIEEATSLILVELALHRQYLSCRTIVTISDSSHQLRRLSSIRGFTLLGLARARVLVSC